MMQRFDEERAEIEKVLWKHYDPDSSLDGEEASEEILAIFSKRFSSLRERVEGLRKECPNHREDEKVECYGYDENFNEAIDAVLRIIDETI